MFWHELAHYRQFKSLGKETYMALERPRVPEQFVFDMPENYNRRWHLLNFEEQQHAIRYITRPAELSGAGGIR